MSDLDNKESSLQERFKGLVEKRDQLVSEKIKLETKSSVAKAELEKLFLQLKEDYGVETIEDAKKQLEENSNQISKILDECDSALKKFEE
jgi:Skp family chaperone for outer membrane proteins